jgi:hypothetical protein
MISRLFGLALLAVTLSGCAEPPYNNLDNEQLKTMLEQGTPLYDIRRPDEWRAIWPNKWATLTSITYAMALPNGLAVADR